MNSLLFVEISLERGKDDPQRIFESLNSTGLELSQADLIRNYILMGLAPAEQVRMFENYWDINDSLGYLVNFVGFVYRTMHLLDAEISRYVVGQSIIENFLISCSYNQNSFIYRNVKFIINSLTSKNIESYTQYGLIEKEVQFRSGLKFLVENIHKDGDQTIIHLTEFN